MAELSGIEASEDGEEPGNQGKIEASEDEEEPGNQGQVQAMQQGVEASGNGEELGNQGQIQVKQQQQEDEENVLNFMDSLDSYLTLLDSLSATLRQGWLELASARHSMGASRINTAMLDLKSHDAATSVRVTPHKKADSNLEQPHFTLCKWSSRESEDVIAKKLNTLLRLRHSETSGLSELDDESSPAEESPRSSTAQNQVQKERLKLLAVFGTLVSPKLRAAQLSFEAALEALVEMANMRSSILLAFERVKQDLDSHIADS